jgi:hypothetical protein
MRSQVDFRSTNLLSSTRNKIPIQTVLEKIQCEEKLIMSAKFLRTALALLLVSMFTACSSFQSVPEPSQADIEKEEQAVYASFFKGNSETIVILQDTSTQWLPSSSEDLKQRLDYIASGLPSASKETLDTYFENNRQPSQLSPDMQLGIHYILLSAEEFSTVMNQPNGWDAFYEKYSPSGYMQFSRVGFNKTLDQAIVYVGSIPGPLMGSGNYYLLEKKDGQWMIKEQVLAWVS